MKYGVSIPLTGWVYLEVEAENEEEALDKAWDKATLDDMVEWEFTKHICRGNVLDVVLNEAEVEEIL